MTSRSRPAAISTHGSQVRQGVGVGPFSQFRAFATILATVVLPTPRTPEKTYAWWIRPSRIALVRVRTIGPCPTTSSKVLGRYFRARAS